MPVFTAVVSFLLVLLCCSRVNGAQSLSTITTSFGNIVGVADSTYQVRWYYNIPYAVAPTGKVVLKK